MSDDLVKRLRAEHNAMMRRFFGTDQPDAMLYDGDMPIRRIKDTSSALKEAAARIEELEAEVERLWDEHVGLCQKLMSDDKARFGDRTIYPYICSVLKARAALGIGKDTP